MPTIKSTDISCPKCHSKNLVYTEDLNKLIEFDNSLMNMSYQCIDCGLEGLEVYIIEYIENKAWVK